MAEERARPAIVAGWRRHASLLGIAYLVLGVGFYATFANMIGVWNHSSTFNHCFLIPFIAIYLGYGQRDQLARIKPETSIGGLLFVLANGVLWLLGEVMSLAFFMHAAVVGMIIGLAWTLLGTRVFRSLMFPLFYLYFAVPEGEFLVPYLQDWTAFVLVKLLQLIGMPVLVEGRYVTIPSGSFTVAEACSGINYLIATLSVGTMFAYLQFRSYWRRALFMLVAVFVPLLANGIRAFGIVMISHLSNYTLAQGVDHFIYGWVFFGFVIFILFWVGRVFSDIDDPMPVTSAQLPAIAPDVSVGRASLMLVLALLASFGPGAVLLATDSARPVAKAIELRSVTDWRGPEAVPSQLGGRFKGADQRLSGRYVAADGAEVSVEIAYYRQQGDDGELINQNNRVFDTGQWRQLTHELRSLPEAVSPLRVNELRLRNNSGEEYLLWYWYDAQGELSSDSFPSKLAEGMARMQGRNVGSAMVSIRTSLANGPAAATASLQAFVGTGAVLIKHLHSQD